MKNIAILIGISDYHHQQVSQLPASANDVDVMSYIIRQSGKYDETLLIEKTSTAIAAKTKISDFITRQKGSKINELFFYFSGHGHRLDAEDFFFVFSDFSTSRLESSTLRNTELDGIIRSIAPDLTIKVIDACFSGSHYVKSNDFDFEAPLKKSAEVHKLNKLYFLHSSSADKVSFADSRFSFFSSSFFKSLTEITDEIRYRDVMSYVADEISGNPNLPQPTFVVQAENTEIFIKTTQEIVDFIKLKLDISSTNQPSGKQLDTPQEKTLAELVIEKNSLFYCNKEETYSSINLISSLLKPESWGNLLSSIFTVKMDKIGAEDSNSDSDFYIDLPEGGEGQFKNEKSIGKWLEENAKSENINFFHPEYKKETYTTQEYVALPPKPKKLGLASLRTYRQLIGIEDETEYKLEKFERQRSVLNGFRCTASAPFKGLVITFNPLIPAVESYCLTIALIFSKKNLFIFTSSEVLPHTSWGIPMTSSCPKWELHKTLLKNQSDIGSLCSKICEKMTNFIQDDIKSKVLKE